MPVMQFSKWPRKMSWLLETRVKIEEDDLSAALVLTSSANVPFSSNFHINSCMYACMLAFLSSCGGNKGLILLL